MNDNQLFVLCTCGHKDLISVDTEIYEHANYTVCVHNLWKGSPNWFQLDFDDHVIEFIGKEQHDYLEKEYPVTMYVKE